MVPSAESYPSALQSRYVAANPRSKALFERARSSFPGAITHDIRFLEPFPIYIERANGSRKWDVDGHEYVDGFMGHGALLLGHNHPEVVAAVQAQLAKGTHYGASHELEVRWAELVRELIPSAERVRFTASGTEATHLAMRLARAYTGRTVIVKLEGHYHGWHDQVEAGVQPPYDVPISIGIPKATLDTVLVVPANDLGAMERALSSRRDIAGILLEPGGGSSGQYPTTKAYLEGLRDLATRHGVVLIFDEVITGFRFAPGGAQAYHGVTPDLTTLAKILAGGLPGGAVAGKAEIVDRIAFTGDAEHDRFRRVAHAGTYNANPLSAAAGIAALSIVKTGEPHRKANAAGERLRRGMLDIVRRQGLEGRVEVFGETSIFNYNLKVRAADGTLAPAPVRAYHALRLGMIEGGADIPAKHGWLSAAHTDADIDRMLAAFDHALASMREERIL
ncbi:MAG TPA: aspartate aminotransferase family protein [Thermodesulfobacteriota bacterium]